MSSPTPPPYLPPPSSPASFPPPLYTPPQATQGKHPKRRVSAAIDAAVMVTAYVVLFAAFHMKDCDQGDWLTCSGKVTYPTSSIVMMWLGAILILGNFFILPLATKGRSIGKLITGVRVVDNATGETARLRTVALRAALNTIIVGGAVAGVPYVGQFLLMFLLAELIALVASGSRLVDVLTRTDVR